MRQGRYIDRTLEVVTIKCEVITGCLSGTCGPVFCPRAGVRINKLVVVVGQGPESISIYYLPCPRESLPITGGTLIIKSVWALLDSAHVLAVSLSFHFHIQSDLGSLRVPLAIAHAEGPLLLDYRFSVVLPSLWLLPEQQPSGTCPPVKRRSCTRGYYRDSRQVGHASVIGSRSLFSHMCC